MKKILIYFFVLTTFGLPMVNSQRLSIRTVVHVLYTNSSNDLSDARVLAVIDSVNKGFNKLLPATFTRSSPIFDTLWSATDIEFCLANTDPSGNSTIGITHTLISDPLMSAMSDPTTIINWSPTTYLNIYLAPCYPEPGSSFVMGGHALRPEDGYPNRAVLVASNVIPNHLSNVLSHEVGHILNLAHVCDESLAYDVTHGCYNPMDFLTGELGYPTTCTDSIQELNTTTLDGSYWSAVVPSIDPPDMVENFMNLSFCCAYMFTKSQRTVMRNYINTSLSAWLTTGCTTVSATEENEFMFDLSTFPMPANHTLHVSFTLEKSEFLNIELMDMNGKSILKNTIQGQTGKNNTSLDLRPLSTGIFLLKISSEKSYQTTKILKE